VRHEVESVQENDAKDEELDGKQPFVRRIEIRPLGQGLEMIVVGFDPEREPHDK